MRAAVLMLALIAALLPACGEPPPAAQKYVDPSSPAEEDGRPMTPSQDPEVVPIRCTMSTCGNGYQYAHFILPMPAATSGWVVQEVMIDDNVTGGEHRQLHYWEGFYVAQGATSCIYAPAGSQVPHDQFGIGDHPSNSTGMTTFIGKAKFYEGTLPADFIRHIILEALDLRATTSQPPFWDGTGTDRDFTITWDCTNGNDIYNVLSHPDPQNVCAQHNP